MSDVVMYLRIRVRHQCIMYYNRDVTKTVPRIEDKGKRQEKRSSLGTTNVL